MTAVVSAVCENKLIPTADFPSKVINGKDGFVRDNYSWIIGRVVRAFESWMDEQPGANITRAKDSKEEDSNSNVVQTPVRT